MLIKFAAKEDIPIAVPYKSWEIDLKYYCKYIFHKNVKIIVLDNINLARGKKIEGILFEEGFKEEDLREILVCIEPRTNHYTGIIEK